MNNINRSMAGSQTMDTSVDAGLRSFMLGIYNNMTLGLAITGLVAFFTSQSLPLMQLINGSMLRWVVMLAPLGFVIYLSARVMKMKPATARMWFFAFAAVMGLSLSYIFLVYTGASIAKVFFITAASFGALSLWGYTTKKNLSGMGSFMMMGLFGIIIAMVVNIFLKSTAMDFAISAIGVVIFAGLTAWDTQRLKHSYYEIGANAEMAGRVAIMGALSLYLDFLNLFLFMLRFMGGGRS
jgi:uncharacterized protein